LFYPRTNSPGAIVGLVAGFLMGMGKLTIQLLYATEEGKEPTSLLNQIADFNFLYASGVLFAATVFLVVLVSNLTAPPREENVKGLTWQSIDKKMVRDSWSTIDLITTAIVLGCVLAIYGYFSFWI